MNEIQDKSSIRVHTKQVKYFQQLIRLP